MFDVIYAIVKDLLTSVGSGVLKIFPKIPKIFLVFFSMGVCIVFSLGMLAHATFPVFKDIAERMVRDTVATHIAQEWLTDSEKAVACQAVIGMSSYGSAPCFSIGQLRDDFKRNKSEAVNKYSDGRFRSSNSPVDFGYVYVVGKSRNHRDYTTNSICSGNVNCLRKKFDLGDDGKIKDSQTNEVFDVKGELAVELPESDFQVARKHLSRTQQPAFVAFIGQLRFEDHRPTNKYEDSHAFVLRLQNSRLISPL